MSSQDARHGELSLKIASLESMIVSLCQQVHMLPSSAQLSVSPTFPNAQNLAHPQEKRQDIK
jgi:hypothetical protein